MRACAAGNRRAPRMVLLLCAALQSPIVWCYRHCRAAVSIRLVLPTLPRCSLRSTGATDTGALQSLLAWCYRHCRAAVSVLSAGELSSPPPPRDVRDGLRGVGSATRPLLHL